MEVEINFFGYEELSQIFDTLPKEFSEKVGRAAVGAGLRVLQKAARANLISNKSVRSGLLLTSLSTRTRVYKKNDVVWGGMGPRKSVKGIYKDKTVIPNNYAHLVEYAPGKSFMRKASDENKMQVNTAVARVAQRNLARQIAQLKRITDKIK